MIGHIILHLNIILFMERIANMKKTTTIQLSNDLVIQIWLSMYSSFISCGTHYF